MDIADFVARNPAALISIARIKTADDYTYLHSVAVCALMIALARHLTGRFAADLRELWPKGMGVRLTAVPQPPRVTGISTGLGSTAYLPSSSLAIALRCTSSGPSAKRNVRALT